VSYTDNELVTSTGASTRTAEDKFIVNTVYSLLRALKVREDLIKKINILRLILFSCPIFSRPQ